MESTVITSDCAPSDTVAEGLDQSISASASRRASDWRRGPAGQCTGVTTESTGVAVGKKPTSMMTLLVTAPMCRSSASSAAGHRRESVDAALAR